jgi:uncharacterized NAD(P)/FAD-binding protein YdhS
MHRYVWVFPVRGGHPTGPRCMGSPEALCFGMDEATILRQLEQARKHVAEGERHIVQQRAIVARLEEAGQDWSQARDLLRQFENSQRQYIYNRNRLEKELRKIQAGQGRRKR